MCDLRVLGTTAALALLTACSADAGADGTPSPSGGSSGAGALAAGASGGKAVGANGGNQTAGGAGSNGSGGSASAAAGSAGLPSAGGAGSPSATGGAAGTLSGTGGAAGSGGMPPSTAGGGAAGAGSEGDYWIATTGADTNPGTQAAPFASVTGALPKVKPGVTLWLGAGTYASAVSIEIGLKYSGTAGKPITLRAAPGARPLIDFSSQPRDMSSVRGINLVADYWRIQGIELTKASDNCIAIAGSNNVIDDVIVHECGDTGIQITAPGSQATDDTRAANNSVINCDSWGNLDVASGGENADGFAAKLRIGPGNLFRGCRAWNNADDGWDLFASDDVVKIENSWAFSNGKPIGGTNPQGDGNGFKLGGAPNGDGQGGAVHLVSGSFAFENKACGFVRNNNPELPQVTACGAKDNKTAYCSLTVSGEVSMSMTAAAAIAAKRSANGNLPPMN